MNKTRQEWSGTFKCCKDKRDSMTAFYGVFSSVFVVTLIFYITVYATANDNESVDVLDARQFSPPTTNSALPEVSAAPSTSSSQRVRNSTKQKKKKDKPFMVINDDSDDDELLIKPIVATNDSDLISISK